MFVKQNYNKILGSDPQKYSIFHRLVIHSLNNKSVTMVNCFVCSRIHEYNSLCICFCNGFSSFIVGLKGTLNPTAESCGGGCLVRFVEDSKQYTCGC